MMRFLKEPKLIDKNLKNIYTAMLHEKKNITTVLIFCLVAAFAAVFFIPGCQNFFIKVVESLMRRQLRDHNKWSSVLSLFGIFIFFMDVSFVLVQLDPFSFFAKIFPKKCEIYLFTLCVIATIIFIYFSLLPSNLYVDETYSLASAKHSWLELLQLGEKADRGHPPLYHIALSVWSSIFGYGIKCARLFSVLPIILFLWIGAYFLKKEISKISAVLFVLLILSSWEIISFSYEVRMYSWALFWIFVSSVFSWYVMKTKKLSYMILFVLAAVLGAYTHYYAAFCLMIYFFVLAMWLIITEKETYARIKNLKHVCIGAAVGIVLYFPWMFCLLRQIAGVKKSHAWLVSYVMDGIPDIAFECFSAIFSTYGFSKCFIFILCFVLVALTARKEHGYERGWLILNFASPFALVVTGVLISILVMPLIIGRYVFPASCLIFLFVSVSSVRLFRKKIVYFILIIFLLTSFHNTYEMFNFKEQRKMQYEEFKNVLDKVITEDTLIVLPSRNAYSWIFGYFYPDNNAYMEDGSGTYNYPFTQIQYNICDMPDVGDFCVIIPFEESENILTNENCLFMGKAGEYGNVYFCKTKEAVLGLM